MRSICIILLVMFFWGCSDARNVNNVIWTCNENYLMGKCLVKFTFTNKSNASYQAKIKIRANRRVSTDSEVRLEVLGEKILEVRFEANASKEIIGHPSTYIAG